MAIAGPWAVGRCVRSAADSESRAESEDALRQCGSPAAQRTLKLLEGTLESTKVTLISVISFCQYITSAGN